MELNSHEITHQTWFQWWELTVSTITLPFNLMQHYAHTNWDSITYPMQFAIFWPEEQNLYNVLSYYNNIIIDTSLATNLMCWSINFVFVSVSILPGSFFIAKAFLIQSSCTGFGKLFHLAEAILFFSTKLDTPFTSPVSMICC